MRTEGRGKRWRKTSCPTYTVWQAQCLLIFHSIVDSWLVVFLKYLLEKVFELSRKKRWMSADAHWRYTVTNAVLPVLKKLSVRLKLCAQTWGIDKIIMDKTERRKGGKSKASCCWHKACPNSRNREVYQVMSKEQSPVLAASNHSDGTHENPLNTHLILSVSFTNMH